MHEIKCPKCGEVFTVDESGYAAISAQVRDEEFHKAIHERMEHLEKEKQNELQLIAGKAEMAKAQSEAELNRQITELKAKIISVGQNKDLEKAQSLAHLQQEIEQLKAQIATNDKDKQLAVTSAVNAKNDELVAKDKQIAELNFKIQEAQNNSQIQQQKIKDEYENQLKAQEVTIKFYKDLKAKMSTKMVGETLEQHCEIEFNRLRATGFQNAYFEKDNDSRKTGSKGDYIFRDFSDDKIEYISIMFEMKNETDTTSTKHKNEDFFKELDKDRTEKKCEYAVLVSLLEPDSELYNTGIVDVSYRYPKMYVIRPQFFIPLITLLRNAAANTVQYKRQLVEYTNQNIDVTNFENKLLTFKDKFDNNVRLAKVNFDKAIEEIDNSIKKLQDVKDYLYKSADKLRLANNTAQDITIKKLTYNNPTMKQKFAEAKKNSEEQ
ncbi:MAG: DUF2130 domain-containing protein [Alphaproteobacteria bacterium]